LGFERRRSVPGRSRPASTGYTSAPLHLRLSFIKGIFAMRHKFKANQTVTYSPTGFGGSHRNVKFEIVRLLPEEHGINQYRIKSVLDGHERVAMESELS
jgi:hypothetical protein